MLKQNMYITLKPKNEISKLKLKQLGIDKWRISKFNKDKTFIKIEPDLILHKNDKCLNNFWIKIHNDKNYEIEILK